MEQSPNPQLSDMRRVTVAGKERHQLLDGKFVSKEEAEAAKARAEAILHETVHELGDVSHTQYTNYREELGLSPVHEHWKSGSAVFDKQSALKAASDQVEQSDDAEAVQTREMKDAHDKKQAFYSEFFGSMSDDELARKAEGISYKKNVAEYTKQHDAKIVTQHEKARKNHELAEATNLKSMSLTELAGLLGEKPSFQTSKAEYIARVEARQSELSKPVKPSVLKVPEPNPSDSTRKTIEAVKKFHKGIPIVPEGRTVEEANSELSIENARYMNEKWEEQTGYTEELLDANKKELASKTKGALLPSPDEIDWADDEWADDEWADEDDIWAKIPMPSDDEESKTGKEIEPYTGGAVAATEQDDDEAIVDDDDAVIPLFGGVGRDSRNEEPIASIRSESLVDAQREKKKGIGKRVAGALAAIGLLGLGVWGAKNLLDNDEKAPVSTVDSEQTTETTGPVVLADPEDVFGDEAAPTTEEPADEQDATEEPVETETTGPVVLADPEDIFGEGAESTDEVPADQETAEEQTSETDEVTTPATDETADEATTEAETEPTADETADTITLEDIVIDENAAPMEAGEGNTAWDRAEAQGLDMDKFSEATQKILELYNEYAASHDLAPLEYRDGNLWTTGTNTMMSPEQYAIFAQIMQDVIANMTGANPNAPGSRIPEAF